MRATLLALTLSDSEDLEDDDEDQVANLIAFSSSHNSNEVVSDKEEEKDKQEEVYENDSNGGSHSSISNFEFDEEIALMAKKFKQFMRFEKKGFGSKGKFIKKKTRMKKLL